MKNLSALVVLAVASFNSLAAQTVTTPPATTPVAPTASVVVAAPAADATKPAKGKMESQVFLWENLKPTAATTGTYANVFDSPTPTLDRFHCHVTTLIPGQSIGPHKHPMDVLFVVKEGTVEVDIDGKKQTVTPGSVIFFASNATETMTNQGKMTATYYVFEFYTALTPKS